MTKLKHFWGSMLVVGSLGLMMVACGDDGDGETSTATSGSSTGTGSGSGGGTTTSSGSGTTCSSGFQCLNGVCECTEVGKEGTACSDPDLMMTDACDIVCEVCM